MSLTKIFLHIGPPKCGTSTTQTFLGLNKKQLLKQGVLYPLNKQTQFKAHHPLARHYYDDTSDPIINWVARYDKDAFYESLEAEIKEHQPKTLVLSSETFWRIDKHSKFKDDLSKYCENIFPFTFIRRQDARLESLYREIRKGGHSTSFKQLISYSTLDMNYNDILNQWAEVFGIENMSVRVLEKEQLKQGLLQEIMNIVGVEPDEMFRMPPNVNVSYSRNVLEYIDTFPAKQSFKLNFIRPCKYLDRYSKENPDTGDNKFHCSPKERLEILDYYKESNAAVARKFLNKEDGELFLSPPPNIDEPWTPYEGLSFFERLKITKGIVAWYVKLFLNKERRSTFLKNHKDRVHTQKNTKKKK
jgi:hypothetical protein